MSVQGRQSSRDWPPGKGLYVPAGLTTTTPKGKQDVNKGGGTNDGRDRKSQHCCAPLLWTGHCFFAEKPRWTGFVSELWCLGQRGWAQQPGGAAAVGKHVGGGCCVGVAVVTDGTRRARVRSRGGMQASPTRFRVHRRLVAAAHASGASRARRKRRVGATHQEFRGAAGLGVGLVGVRS